MKYFYFRYLEDFFQRRGIFHALFLHICFVEVVKFFSVKLCSLAEASDE